MPPTVAGTRVAIGGGGKPGGDMRQASKGSGFGASGSRDTRTFKGGQGGGSAVKNTIYSSKSSSGGPEQKGGTSVGTTKTPSTNFMGATGKNPQTKSPSGVSGVGLQRTAKGGNQLSSKGQPMVPGGQSMHPSVKRLT